MSDTDSNRVDFTKPEIEFRCGSRLHAIRIGGVMEILCRNCRHGESGVIAHYFSIETGELLESRRFESVAKLRHVKRVVRSKQHHSAKSAAD